MKNVRNTKAKIKRAFRFCRLKKVINWKGWAMRIAIVFLACLLLTFIAGCQGDNTRLKLASEVSLLKQQNRQCENQLKKAKAEVEHLKQQVTVLSGLKPGFKAENLYNLQSLVITRYTGFYEDDGKKKRLLVYIQPIDEQGDVIKAAGSVDVQLWDLSKPDKALFAEWRIEPDELKKMWVATLFSINYRLPFDVADKIAGLAGDLTVRVTLTDYLSGKVFTEQKVVKLDYLAQP